MTKIGVLKKQGLKNRVASKEALFDQVQKFQQQRKSKVKKISWQFTTEDAVFLPQYTRPHNNISSLIKIVIKHE